MASSPVEPPVSGSWAFPQGQDLGHAMTLTAVGLGMYGLATAGYPSVAVPAGCLALSCMIGQWSIPLWLKRPALDLDEGDVFDGDFGDLYGGYDAFESDITRFSEDVQNDLRRIRDVVTATWKGELELLHNESEEDGGVLVAYKMRSVTPGYLTDGSTKTRVTNKMTNAVPASRGGWTCTFDNKKDVVTVSQKSSIPDLALPPNWHVVRSLKEAKTAYRKFEMTLGPGEDGKMVTFKPQVFPHAAVIATSGGGKSVFLRACIEQVRSAAGGQILLGDGKGSDYSTLRNQPGIIGIGRGSGSKGLEYIAAIEIAFRVMQQRQNTAAERKMADPDGWEDLPPVFLILDELKSVLKKWSTELDKKSMKAIESKVNQILALGRQMRVHVYSASQDVYAESIPPSWLTNIGMKISLGKPHHLTISKGFDEAIRDDAMRIANGIDPNVRGRGMIAGMDEDSGLAAVRAYQGFLGYSPGESMPGFLNQEQQGSWNFFKENVSEAVPRLYSRKWFKIDEPSEAQLKQEAATDTPFGYIDFEMFSVDEISALPIINLDMRDSNGRIVPDPAMLKYDSDPTNAEYVCRPVLNTNNTVTDI